MLDQYRNYLRLLARLEIGRRLVNNRMIADEQAKTAKRAEEAEERFRLAKRSMDEMIQFSEEELADKPNLLGLRKRLLQSALGYYQEFIDQQSDVPAVQEELRETKSRVEKILADLAVLQGAGRLFLLGQPAVQDELSLSDAERKKIGELGEQWMELFGQFGRLSSDERGQRALDQARAHDAVLTTVLAPEQVRRLGQIALQVQGPAAFREPDVAAALKLTAQQRKRIQAIEQEAFFGPKQSHEAPARRGGADGGAGSDLEGNDRRAVRARDALARALRPAPRQCTGPYAASVA